MLLMIFVSGTLLEALDKQLACMAHPGPITGCRCPWYCGPLQCFYSHGSRHDWEHRYPAIPRDLKGQNMKRYAKAVLLLLAVAGTTPLGRFCDVE